MIDIVNKKILVVGLGKSGIAASKLLLNKGAKVWITEQEDNSGLRAIANDLGKLGATIELGKHSRDFVEGAELAVVCPGVGHGSKIIQWINELKIPLMSELELASWYIKSPIVAVTGTNGKSTVTSLIEHIFKCNGKNVKACGNIGVPLSEVVLGNNNLDLVIVEVSSFQLEHIDTFKPQVAVWLNFSCDHMDEHYSMENYLKAKLNIFKNQKYENWAVIYYKEVNRVKAMVKSQMKIFRKDNIKFRGAETFKKNIAAAVQVAEIYGINKKGIEYAVKTFKPLPHRLEHVALVDGINFINDSKSTNTGSVLAALESLEKPIVLILGGRDKGDDFTKLKQLIQEKVSNLITIGEARNKIYEQLKYVVSIERIPELYNAVIAAYKIATKGTIVLFSPGCSSFDMFKDYKERGNVFSKCVNDLKSKNIDSNFKIPSLTEGGCLIEK